ncbi:hypothetical protein IID19_05580 [Patescibacteria group bacterium]|nr:hypothetical protein [Patescibacteria group bacterium]
MNENLNDIKSVLPEKKEIISRTRNRMNIKSTQILQIVFVLILVGSGIISWNSTHSSNTLVDQKTALAKEDQRPANLSITIVTDKICKDCSSIIDYIDFIKDQNVNVVSESLLDIEDAGAQDLINKYGIKKVPFFTVAGELNKIQELSKSWADWGSIVDEVFVFTQVSPPYLSLPSGIVAGRVSIAYLADKSCSECYDVTINKQILEDYYQMKISSELTIDVSSEEGKQMLSQYNITKIPTFILDNEAANYESLLKVWSGVGSIEKDSMYVLRNLNQLGVYYDLEKGELVRPETVEDK